MRFFQIFIHLITSMIPRLQKKCPIVIQNIFGCNDIYKECPSTLVLNYVRLCGLTSLLKLDKHFEHKLLHQNSQETEHCEKMQFDGK